MASDDEEGIQGVSPAAANEGSQPTEAEKKTLRLKTAPKLSKPTNSSQPVWKHYQVYKERKYSGLSICRMCFPSGAFGSAEVKFGQGSPTNLMVHLNTGYPGHRDVYKELLKQKTGGVPTAGTIHSFMEQAKIHWHDDLICLIVHTHQPLSFAEWPEFHTLTYKLNNKAKPPSRSDLLDRMREIKAALEADVSLMLDGEFVAITNDGWTSRKNDSYMSLTVAYIDAAWKLHTLSLDCSEHTGTTTGEDLANGIAAMIERHDLTGRVTACVTDCEPSMVKAGRLLEAGGGLLTHVGCSNHRFESTTSSVFNGRSLGALSLARGVLGRYKKSSQMAARLSAMCGILEMPKLSVVHNVETRWWSTWAMINRLLYLKKPIQQHESIDNINPLLSETDWEVLRLIDPLLEPFMSAQKKLEGATYVTGSLVIPEVAMMRSGLKGAIEDLRDVPPPGLAVATRAAMEIVRPDAEALWSDFTNRWGDGSSILEYKEGRRRQPQGFKLQQVFATALDPRAKHLYGIHPQEQPSVWHAVASEAVESALRKQASDKTALPVRSPSGEPAVETLPVTGAGSRDPKRSRLNPFEAAAAAHAAGAGAGSIADESTDEVRERLSTIVDMEVSAFKTAPGLCVSKEVEGATVYNDPLDWWRKKEREYPLLAALARRVLAIPASQAQSERMFSTAGLVVTPTRNRLLAENVELLVYLRNVWNVVDEWRKSASKKSASK